MYFRGNCYLASPASSFEEKCPSVSMRIDTVFYPRAPLRMTARNQKRKHWGREWFKTNMAAFRASLHAPSSLVCSAAESDNSSEDELPFDENIPLAGYKDEDEEAIGDVEAVSSQTSRPNSGSKKKAGRRPTWREDDVTDLVDIVCNSEYFKRKIIFTNSKNTKNNEIYGKLLKDLKERALARGDEFSFTVNQVRNKLKKLISECKKAALTIKTATGIDRFQEEKNYGPWFAVLFALVKTRDSCQPDRAIEPTASGSSDVLSNGSDHSSASSSPVPVDDSEESAGEKKIFVPIKNRGKKRKDFASSAVECMEKLLEKDPTKDLLEFYREENEKARKHEMQLMQMIMSTQVQDSGHFPPQGNSLQYGYSYPSQHSYQYMESGNMAPNYINL